MRHITRILCTEKQSKGEGEGSSSRMRKGSRIMRVKKLWGYEVMGVKK